MIFLISILLLFLTLFIFLKKGAIMNEEIESIYQKEIYIQEQKNNLINHLTTNYFLSMEKSIYTIKNGIVVIEDIPEINSYLVEIDISKYPIYVIDANKEIVFKLNQKPSKNVYLDNKKNNYSIVLTRTESEKKNYNILLDKNLKLIYYYLIE